MSTTPNSPRVPATPADRFVGIDVAKAHLDVAVRPDGTRWQVANDAEGIATLVRELHALAPTLVVLEATGGYELPVAGELEVAGLFVAVVNPRQVRHFAQATGRLAKTDRLDAAVLAHFGDVGDVLRPRVTPLPSAEAQELAAWVERRRELVAMRTAEAHRLGATQVQPVRTRIAAHLTWLEQELADLDRELRQRLEQSPLWHARDQALREVKGVGPILSLTLLAHPARSPCSLTLLAHPARSPARARPSLPQAARRAGGGSALQPRQWARPRPACGVGRPGGGTHGLVHGHAARRALQSAHPGVLPAAARGGQGQAGKAKKVALVACMHKLLTHLNALAHQHPAWRAAAATLAST